MDHIEVLMRLFDAEGAALTRAKVEELSRLGTRTVSRALDDLVTSGLAAADQAAGSFRLSPRGPGDRATIEALAALYHQRPVTLVKLVYTQPPSAVQSFSDAFRLRGKPGED